MKAFLTIFASIFTILVEDHLQTTFIHREELHNLGRPEVPISKGLPFEAYIRQKLFQNLIDEQLNAFRE